MKSPIKQQAGFFELLLIFPIFLGLLLGLGLVGWILIEKTKIEKLAWYEQTIETFDIKTPLPRDYEITNNAAFHVKEHLSNIPLSFRETLLENPSTTKTITYRKKTPTIFRDEPDLQLSSDFFVPGSSLHRSSWTRNKLLQEAMQKSGFGLLYPIDTLGYREIAIAAGLPLDALPEWVTEIVNHLQKE